MSKELLLKWVDIKSIKPYNRNSRKNENTIDIVAESIKTYGWQQPIVIDKDMIIVAGHSRWLAAQKLNYDKVPVIEFKGTKTQCSEYRLLDNRAQEDSDWNKDLLKSEMQDLDLPTGFTDLEIENILGKSITSEYVEPTVFEIVIDVESEEQQKELFEWATKQEGRECRILTI